jgi:hypothetical protein
VTVQHARRFEGGQLGEVIFDCAYSGFEPLTRGGAVGCEAMTFGISSWVGHGELALFLSTLPRIKTVFLGKGQGESKHQILRRLKLKEYIHDGARNYTHMRNFGKLQVRSFHGGINGFDAPCHGDIFPYDDEAFSALFLSQCIQGWRDASKYAYPRSPCCA